MGLFDKMKEPIFLKENSTAEAQLEKLKNLEPLLNAEGQDIIRQDIKCLEYGIIGEKNIAFELKNSHMPLYVLHDIYLVDGDLSAQIDYLVFTKKLCFVIECKNLYGNVEINSAGDFIRTMEFGSKKKKEGIYSPITQNQRHLEIMKKLRVNNKNNLLTKFMTDRYFEDLNKSVVVLANPKTVLNAKFAKKEIKEKVIRADQLVKYIKDVYDNSKESVYSDDKFFDWAKFYLDLHREVEIDYTDKYEQYRISCNTQSQNIKTEAKIETSSVIGENKVPSPDVIPTEETLVYKKLKAYRLEKSREEKIKPYFIYNDNQLKDLIVKMPKNNTDLQTVNGFGEAKVKKYGLDILRIIENANK